LIPSGDAGCRAAAYRRQMLDRRGPSPRLIGRVLAAARAATDDGEVAERATVRAFAAAGGRARDGDELAARAVRLALRESPAAAFAAIAAEDAEAIALARLVGLPETRIAALLGISRDDVRLRFTRGLRTWAAAVCA
jgi:DNA-directed RNA polymerase specialized sigma24 family protein